VALLLAITIPSSHSSVVSTANFCVLGLRGLIYKTSYDEYTTMLRHTESLRQIYDKPRFTKNRMRKLR